MEDDSGKEDNKGKEWRSLELKFKTCRVNPTFLMR